MSEEHLKQIAEDAFKILESIVESSTLRVNDTLKHTMKFNPIRLVTKPLHNITGIGLIITSIDLNQKNYHAIAKVCFWSGSITLATNLAIANIIYRK